MIQNEQTINFSASDVTGQRTVTVRDVPSNNSVGEFVDELLPTMRLSATDRSGDPVHYSVRLERESRILHRNERLGDVIEENDEVTLMPRISAGGSRPAV
jgi:hypothetical protein